MTFIKASLVIDICVWVAWVQKGPTGTLSVERVVRIVADVDFVVLEQILERRLVWVPCVIREVMITGMQNRMHEY